MPAFVQLCFLLLPSLASGFAFVRGGGSRVPLLLEIAPISRTPLRTTFRDVDYDGINHAGVLCSDTDASLRFYLDVLGMEDDTHLRPKTLPYPGAFVKVGGNQIHLMQLPNPDPKDGRPDYPARDRHLALSIRRLRPLIERLDKHRVPYKLSSSGRPALFTRDPDGNGLEFVALEVD